MTRLLALLGTTLALACAPAALAQDYDLVLANGRVIDPETGLDAVRHVGIRDGEIVAVSETPLDGDTVRDVTGRIVAPGFIDMHAHGQTIPSARMQAMDGVTTALELEAGILPVGAFYDRAAAEGRPINYGAAAGWAHARIAVMENDPPQSDTHWFLSHFGDENWQEIADADQLDAILALTEQGLDEGGLGIGILVGYSPDSGRREYHAVNALAARRDVPTYTHARYLGVTEPESSFEGYQEMVAVAVATGAQMHVCHLNSMSLTDIDAIADMIGAAQALGARISVEAYPYGAGSTGIGAAMFRGEGWRDRLGGIEYSDFTAAGEPLDQARFDALQAEAPGTEIVVHMLDPENDPQDQAYLDRSILYPGGAIASDGGDWQVDGHQVAADVWPIPEEAESHPRSAGTYGRFLRIWVRERGMLDWPEAIAKTSYYPATILEDSVPQMRRRGRLQEGAVADIVVIDPDSVSDRSTYETPAQASVGFDYVIVGGQVLVDHGTLDTTLFPGEAIRRPVAD